MEFAALPEYVAVARRVAEVVGARGGLGATALEDLQIAISEVCNRLVTAAHASPGATAALRLRFWLEADRVVVEIGGSGEVVTHALADLPGDPFAAFLLKRLVDGVAPVAPGAGPALRIEKLRPRRE
ncbi:MAG: ATP-binding protein [Armatimonadetes bacterium]|nr:ATP-binding protein [Armatimonadota bacterium]